MASRKKKKNWRKQSRRVIAGIFLVVIVCCCVLIYGTKTLEAKEADYIATEERLENELMEAEAESEALEEEEAYVQTRKYAEETAKTKLGLVYPDETVLRPNSED